jgi:hypothetical protein
MRSIVRSLFVLSLVLLAPATARAQFGQVPFSDPATGETYHIEFSGGFWNPTPEIIVASEALGIAGTNINGVTDLGITQKQFREFRLVLRPGRKHKFRLHYLPLTYTAQKNLNRDFIFNGVRYRVGLPVTTTFDWKSTKIGYEYDFVYRDRGYAGFFMDIKFTDIKVDLQSPIASDFAHAAAPIPTIGGVGRVYIVPNISVTFELTGIKIPESVNQDYKAHYFDFDLYGTVNFNDYVGAQIGYRSLDLGYLVERDSGTLKMKGIYFGGVLRY